MTSSNQSSGGGIPLDVGDIQSLLHKHQARKRTGHFQNGSDWAPELPSVPRTMQSSLGYGTRISARQSFVSSGNSSYMVSTAGASSVFDTTASTSSTSTILDPAEEAPLIYECEFNNYTDCGELHALGDEGSWFEHIALVHMREKYPEESWCWFCDRVFKPRENEDRKGAFHRRMMHIASHIRKNNGIQMERRPDMPLIKHLDKYGLVPPFVLDAAKTYHEAPQPKDIEFCELSEHARGRKVPETTGQRGHRVRESYTIAHRGRERRSHNRY